MFLDGGNEGPSHIIDSVIDIEVTVGGYSIGAHQPQVWRQHLEDLGKTVMPMDIVVVVVRVGNLSIISTRL